METLFTSEYRWLWTVVLGVMLFFPVRQLIWVLSVRRHERRTGKEADDPEDGLIMRVDALQQILARRFGYVGSDPAAGIANTPEITKALRP